MGHHRRHYGHRPDLEMPYVQYLEKLGHSKEEIDLINISSNYNDVYETSVMNSFHARAFRQFNGTKRLFNFEGGSKVMVNALDTPFSSALVLLKPIDRYKTVTGGSPSVTV